MAAITFPSEPALNATHTVGNRTWKFNGTAWKLQPKTTTDIHEGTNLYYTDTRVAAAPAVIALETRAGNIEATATTLAGRVTSAEGSISTLTSGLATEKGRIDAILDASTADADNFKEIVDLINSVDLTNDNALASAVLSINDDITAVEGRMDTLEGNLTGEFGSITQLFNEVGSVAGRVDAIEADFQWLGGKENIASSGDIQMLRQDIDDLNSYANTTAALQQEITTARGTDAQGNPRENLNARLVAIEGRATSIETTANSRIDTAEEVIGSLLSQATDASLNIAALDGRLDTAEGTLEGLGTMSTQNASAVAITGGTITGIALTASSLEVGSGQTVDLFVSQAGNVGIGTETPSERLSVAGNITATGTVSAAAPTASTHLTTKAYVDAADSALQGDIEAVETSLQAEVTRATAAEQSLSASIASLTSGLASSVLDAVLTGLSTATNAAISATDSVLVAFGKLQAQVSAVLSSLNTHVADTNNPHAVTKAQVGLGAADNTSDADKPVSTAQASAIAARQIADTLGATAPAHENGRRWVDTTDMTEYVSFGGAWIELDRA